MKYKKWDSGYSFHVDIVLHSIDVTFPFAYMTLLNIIPIK